MFTAGAICPVARNCPLARRRRCRRACDRAAKAIAEPSSTLLFQAEQLRIARQSLAEVLGIDATEIMLDGLFARFCVGK